MLRTIVIRPVLNGFMVDVGCQCLAYTSIEKLIVDLSSYLARPEETEKRLLPEFINRKHTHPHPFNGGPIGQPVEPAGGPGVFLGGTQCAPVTADCAQPPPCPPPPRHNDPTSF